MATRADFYIGRGPEATWIGSVAMDGSPAGDVLQESKILEADTETLFVDRVKKIVWRKPEDGWPWWHEDSTETDYAYAFDLGRVWVSDLGREWLHVEEALKDEAMGAWISKAVFPKMNVSGSSAE